LRAFNDAAPNIVFAIEGMVGNQMEPDRGGYTAAYTDDNALLRVYGGVDYVVAKLGGAVGCAAGRGAPHLEPDRFGHPLQDRRRQQQRLLPRRVCEELRLQRRTGSAAWRRTCWQGSALGKDVFRTYGDLINALDFNLASKAARKEMGGELKVASGDKVTVTIRFKQPAQATTTKSLSTAARPPASSPLSTMST
jgi:hypothetical protein